MERAVILVCGEALMDVYPRGDTALGCLLDARVGGSPFNVAVGLARLGQVVGFCGGLSRDTLGARLLRALRDEGVSDAPVVRFDAPTTLSLVDVDERGQPAYAFHGQGAADRALTVQHVQDLALRPAAVHVGSYTLVVDPVSSALRHLVQREHSRALISFDPNVRTTVQPDLARWRDGVAWMASRADLLKVSDEDLALLYADTPMETLAHGWLAQGVGLVVVTRGAQGAIGFTAQHRVAVPGLPCTLVDTVGAGDTFQAALLTWLAEHDALSGSRLRALSSEQIEQALAFSARAASITCSRRGADLPRRAELA